MANRSDAYKARLTLWRKCSVVSRTDGPVNPVRAHSLGYKATKDFITCIVRVKKGKRTRPKPAMGRKPGKNVKRVPFGRSLGWIAEQKAIKRFSNLELVASYIVGSDGVSAYYEVILRNRHSSKPVLHSASRAIVKPAEKVVKPAAVKAKPAKKPVAKPKVKPAVKA